MKLTIDNCVVISSLKKEEGSEESRTFLGRIGMTSDVEVYQPVVFILEALLAVPRAVSSGGLDLGSLRHGRGFTTQEFVEVTAKDAFDFIPTTDQAAAEIVAKVKPAADLLYVIVAQKRGATLVTL